ncbi:hypothetical protein C8F04DRAFT_1270561 [Mycena alexandri]|uniref:Uncharacterized protein n=1 Tax=Mycena alexandri TaxID=1745969 RepID=A0AAD6WT01_9AGAR|nr:hypothetical protein C8F04DRAFT_1270561 [Mycena alexandri]
MAIKTERAALSDSGDNPNNDNDNNRGPSGAPKPSTPPPARSTPPRQYHGTWRDTTMDPDYDFGLEPLEDPTGPLDRDIMVKEALVLTVDMNLPSTQSVAKIAGHPQIKARHNKALSKGLKTIHKTHLLSAGLATQRLFLAVFPDELELLNNVFTQAKMCECYGTFGTGYKVVTNDYEILLRVLFNHRFSAEDPFRLAGKRPPKMPSWGADNDLEEYYTLNDFEILAVCFRAEVEITRESITSH